MKNLDLISSNVFNKKEICENTIIVYYEADLLDIPPFMSSPYLEDIIWSTSTKNLINYIFDILIANYLINDAMAFGEYIYDEREQYDFIKSVDVYKTVKKNQISRLIALEEIVDLYKCNYNQELTYLDLVKLLIKIEKIIPSTAISLKFKTYSTPLEIRHSKRELFKKIYKIVNIVPEVTK